MAFTITHSHLNSVAAVADMIRGCNNFPTKVLALPRQVVSLVNIRSSWQNNYCYIKFSSRPSTNQFHALRMLPTSKLTPCRSSYTCNCSTSFENEEDSCTDNNNTNIANTNPLSDNRMRGSSSLSSSSRSCSCNYNNNNDENNMANTSPSSYDRIGGSSSSLSCSTRSCCCNCQNTSPSIQINIVFPQLSASPTIEMIAHVYSKIHPLLDQLMLFVQHKSLFFFQVAVSDKERVLRRKVNKIAENADASTLNGLDYVFKEVVKALLQYNYSSIHFTKLNTKYGFLESLSKNYEEFLNVELESHGKDEDIFVNIDDSVEYKNEGSMDIASRSIENDYTVVTMLVLATGRHLIPDFKGKGARYDESLEVLQTKGDRARCYDFFDVLRTLERIPKKELQSVKVLWSPRKEDKVLLEDELLRDFPRLIRIENGLLYGQVKA
ncbi:hypothetical protein POM88_051657 [Heracleum sosnowskyi]|uniref:Uncharacterized protein n=1 Tax=Heracleum sosnowskyi TaxID=360622 RepID=A0AAD8H0W4_9APIA|nr:hypothetical protein POM88_051657 [Heracleum sosnowskyi]